MDDAGANFVRWTYRSDDILKHLKTKPNTYRPMEMCQHGKTNMSIYRISEYCEKLVKFGSSFKNLAQEISIWRMWWQKKKISQP